MSGEKFSAACWNPALVLVFDHCPPIFRARTFRCVAKSLTRMQQDYWYASEDEKPANLDDLPLSKRWDMVADRKLWNIRQYQFLADEVFTMDHRYAKLMSGSVVLTAANKPKEQHVFKVN